MPQANFASTICVKLELSRLEKRPQRSKTLGILKNLLKKGENVGRRLNSGLLGRNLARKGMSDQSRLLHFPGLLVWRCSLRAFEICDVFHEPAKKPSSPELGFQAVASEER